MITVVKNEVDEVLKSNPSLRSIEQGSTPDAFHWLVRPFLYFLYIVAYYVSILHQMSELQKLRKPVIDTVWLSQYLFVAIPRSVLPLLLPIFFTLSKTINIFMNNQQIYYFLTLFYKVQVWNCHAYVALRLKWVAWWTKAAGGICQVPTANSTW